MTPSRRRSHKDRSPTFKPDDEVEVMIPEGFNPIGGRRSATVLADVSSQYGRGVYLLRYDNGTHDNVPAARIIKDDDQ